MPDNTSWFSKLTQRHHRTRDTDPSQATTTDALAPFRAKLNALRDLADTAPDWLHASTYDSVWRTMGEELTYIAYDLDTGRLAETDLPAKLAEWNAIGRAHLAYQPDAADQVFPAAQLAEYPPGLTLPYQADAETQPDESASDTDPEFQEAARLQRERVVENAVRHAYDMQIALAAENGDDSKTWIDLAAIRTELGAQARLAGRDPDSREDVDAALQRMTHDQDSGPVHVIPQDREDLLGAAERDAAVRFGGADRHMMMIEDHADQQIDGDGSDTAGDENVERRTLPTADEDTKDDHVSSAVGDKVQRRHDERAESAVEDAWQRTDTADDDAPEDDRAGTLAADSPRQHEARDDLRAQIESSACTAAIQRAEVTVDRVRDQAGTPVDGADRDAELARWHADDTAARVEDEQAIKDTAADLGSPLADV